MVSVGLTVDGAPAILARLAGLDSGDTRRRVLARIAKDVAGNSKKRVRAQTTLSGAPFSPRRPRSGKLRRKRMLTKYGQLIKVLSVTGEKAEVGYADAWKAGLAGKHQFGFSQRVTREQVRRGPGSLAMSANATRRQANALLNVGFKIRRTGRGGFKTPSINWITSNNRDNGRPNMTVGQAGAILRDLRTQQNDYWITTLPPRSFLGVADADVAGLETAGLEEINRQLV